MPVFGIDDLLDTLCVQEGDLIFLHTSFRRLRSRANSPRQLISALLRRLGPRGTLVMPRYAWHLDPKARPWKGYAEYLRRQPVLDLRVSPANIGAVPEAFRCRPDVKVSVSHCWPVAALGPRADEIVAEQVSIHHAYGPDSSFGRLLDWNVRIVGMGVTLNTNSIAPVTDFMLGRESSLDIFTDTPLPGTVIDLAANVHRTCAVTMRPECVRNMKLSRILDGILMPGVDFPFEDDDGSFFFSYPARLYHETAMSVGRQALGHGLPVPWMDGSEHVQ